MDGKRFAAVDTHFLIALYAGDEDCEAVVDWLTSHNIYVFIPSCVIQELVDMEDNASTPEFRGFAKDVQSYIVNWGFMQSRPLSATNNGIAHGIAQKICDRGLIDSGDYNDCLVLVEAAFDNCVFLVTSRDSLINANSEQLKIALLESHVSDVSVISPKWLRALLKAK